MYLTFHYRPPHEKDPGGLRHEKEQNAAGVGSSQEEEPRLPLLPQLPGGSPQGEVPGSNVDPKPRPAPKKRPRLHKTPQPMWEALRLERYPHWTRRLSGNSFVKMN